MAAVGGKHIANVDALVLEQLFVVGVHLGVGRAVLLGSLFSLFGDDVAEGNQISTVDGLQSRKVLAVGDAAASDDTNFEPRHRKYLLIVVRGCAKSAGHSIAWKTKN